MVAYSFNPRFELPIVTLRKTGTIRAHGRRRHARPGERLQLYIGMRTRSCRLLATAECQASDRLRVSFQTPRVIVGEIPDEMALDDINHCADFDAFAQADGFADFEDMARFWWDLHRARAFDHLWIRWQPASVLSPALPVPFAKGSDPWP